MTSTEPRTREPQRTRRPDLPPPARKAVLVVHLLSAASWIGIDVVVAVLVGLGALSPDPIVRGAAYLVLGTSVALPMLLSSLLCLASGLLLGLGTRWGLVRYWWVAVKLVLNLGLCAAILLVLTPELPEVADHGRALLAAEAAVADVSSLVFPPLVSLTALTVATTLAAAKPWGRIRRPRSRGAELSRPRPARRSAAARR